MSKFPLLFGKLQTYMSGKSKGPTYLETKFSKSDLDQDGYEKPLSTIATRHPRVPPPTSPRGIPLPGLVPKVKDYENIKRDNT